MQAFIVISRECRAHCYIFFVRFHLRFKRALHSCTHKHIFIFIFLLALLKRLAFLTYGYVYIQVCVSCDVKIKKTCILRNRAQASPYYIYAHVPLIRINEFLNPKNRIVSLYYIEQSTSILSWHFCSVFHIPLFIRCTASIQCTPIVLFVYCSWFRTSYVI